MQADHRMEGPLNPETGLPQRVYGTAALHACQPEPEDTPAEVGDDVARP